MPSGLPADRSRPETRWSRRRFGALAASALLLWPGPALASLLVHWPFDDPPGSTFATDVSGNGHHATLQNMDPATDWVVDGCHRAIDFDGNDDLAATGGLFNLPGTGTVAFWMQVPGPPTTQGHLFGVGLGWEVRHVDAATPEGVPFGLVLDLNVLGPNLEIVTTTPISAPGVWTHVAATFDNTTQAYAIYLDGLPHKAGVLNLLTVPQFFTLEIPGTFSIGTRTGSSENFRGKLDDLRIYDHLLTPAEIALLALPPSCAADHFSISHDGQGLNCQAEPVTIRAHDATHGVEATYTGTITLSTSTGHGDWSLISGSGVLTNVSGGSASYTYAATDAGEVVLGLLDSYAETVDIDVSDGAAVEDLSEDPALTFDPAGFVWTADGAPDGIGTQIGGKLSSQPPGVQVLELQAVRTSDQTGACEAALTGLTDVELAFDCEDPLLCAGSQVEVNGVAIAANPSGPPTLYTTVALDFGTDADSTAPIDLRYPDVGRVQLHARKTLLPSGQVMAGSSNSFVFRPFGFDVTVTGNPAASNENGPIFGVAGDPFTTQLRAVLWSAADDGDADGRPDGHADTNPTNDADLSDNASAVNYGREILVEAVELRSSLIEPAGGVNPGLAGGTTLAFFVGGAASSTTTRFDEVGIADVYGEVADLDYLGIGAPDTAGILGRAGRVGRFTPSDLAVSANAAELETACGSFAYQGQLFGYATQPVLSVEARASTGTRTQNYTGVWWKVTNTTLTRTYDSSTNPLPLDTSGLPPSATDPAIVDIGDGTGTLTYDAGSGLLFTRGGPLAPFDARIDLVADVIDADGIAYASNPVGWVDMAWEGGAGMRFGRMQMQNAHGSELAPLPVPLRTEYFDGNVYLPSLGDSCTPMSPGLVSLSPTPVTLSTTPSTNEPTVVAGDSGLTLSAPGAGNTGHVDLIYDLSALDYLQFDWDGDSAHDDFPSARAIFGIWGGADPIIFRREVY